VGVHRQDCKCAINHSLTKPRILSGRWLLGNRAKIRDLEPGEGQAYLNRIYLGVTVNRIVFVLLVLIFTVLTTGCSKLTRREATHQIDAMMKPHPVGARKIVTPGGYVPGFTLPQDDHEGMLGQYFPVGRTDGQPEAIEDALVKLGYIAIQDGGPGLVDQGAFGHDYGPQYRHADSTRIISLTEKVGKPTSVKGWYSVGFHRYEEPNPTQCDLPASIETIGNDYQITGITQDDVHAKVNILIPWRLTPFGVGLKPFASALNASKPENITADWAKFLNAHALSGSSPATILFQKFDDGWRIVDEQGRSEKDFN